MRVLGRVYFPIIIVALIAMGCAPQIPKSEYPAQRERSFNASFDKAWDAVSEVVKTSNGTIITADKSSGLISYSLHDKSGSPVYMNVYLKKHPTESRTIVYITPRIKGGPYLEGIEKDFYSILENTLKRG